MSRSCSLARFIQQGYVYKGHKSESEATFGLPGRSNSRCSPCTSSSCSLAHTAPRCHRNSPRKASLRCSRAWDLPEMADDRRQQKPTSINHYAAGVSATAGLTHREPRIIKPRPLLHVNVFFFVFFFSGSKAVALTESQVVLTFTAGHDVRQRRVLPSSVSSDSKPLTITSDRLANRFLPN